MSYQEAQAGVQYPKEYYDNTDTDRNPARGIGRTTNELKAAIERLGKTVDDIYVRLNPILAPAEPAEIAKDGMAVVRPSQSDIATYLEHRADDIVSLCNTLESIYHRIDL